MSEKDTEVNPEIETVVDLGGVDCMVKAYVEWVMFLDETEPRAKLHIISVCRPDGTQVFGGLNYPEAKKIQRELTKEYREKQVGS